MAIPQLSSAQLEAAREAATQARRARAELKEQVKIGAVSFTDALNKAVGDDTLSRIKVAPEGKGSLTVALWGKNLTNEKYLTLAFGGWTNDSSGSWGEPRTVGMDLIYQY